MKREALQARRWVTGILGAATVLVCAAAQAEHSLALGDGLNLSYGGDMRIRLEGYDRPVTNPDMTTMDNGPAYQYLRVRTRVWGSLSVEEWMKINACLTNRSQHFTSRPGENNDGPATWEFPDEVILERLNIQLINLGDSDWTLTLGRQDFPLGNGMVFLEGTPYDQGRTIYFDGLSAVMKKEKDTLKLFAFYNDYKDKTVFIDDQNRPLRRGDIFTPGVYWTHTFRKGLNTDLYYIFADVTDHTDTPGGDADADIHTAGGRVFGALHEQVDYSIEYAQQFGEYDRDEDVDLTGDLLDVRLTFKAPKDTLFSPSVMLQYVSFSGNDPSSADEDEGWDPIFAAYPIFREELLPVMNRGDWTNLDMYRVEGRAKVNQCWTVTAAYAYLAADFGDETMRGMGGQGDSLGHLVSLFVDYKPVKWLSFAFEVAELFPSSYWDDGDNCTWGRFQTTVTF